MRKMIRRIAAVQAAVMMMTSAAFAEELFDDAAVPVEDCADAGQHDL